MTAPGTVRIPAKMLRRALLVSVVLHLILLLGFRCLGSSAASSQPEKHTIDSRVLGGRLFLSAETRVESPLPPAPGQIEASEPDTFSVRVLPPRERSQDAASSSVGPRILGTLPGGSGSSSADREGPGTRPGVISTGRETASFFAVPVATDSVVLVVDRSLSMGLRGGLARVRQELLLLLSRLDDTQRFQIIFYNETPQCLDDFGQPALRPVTRDNVEQASNWVRSITASGSTNHVRAVIQALNMRPKLLLLVTDGDGLTAFQIRDISRHNGGQTAIHVIESSSVGGATNRKLLEQLARNNGGKVHSPFAPISKSAPR